MSQPTRSLTLSDLWILASLAVCILMIAILGLMPVGSSSFLFDSIISTGHFFFFGLLALFAARATSIVWPPSRRPRWLPLAIGFAVAVLAGGLLEFVQQFVPPRSPSWRDLSQDSLGALTGVCLLHFSGVPAVHREQPRGARWVSLVLLLTATTLACAPLVTCLIDYGRRNNAFPVLVDFRASWPQRFLKIDETVQLVPTTPPPLWAAGAADNVAQLRIGTGRRFPGWAMKEPYPAWPADAELVFDVLVSSPDRLQLILRVHDAEHNDDYYDRFNRTLDLAGGFQQVRIPVPEIRDGPRSRQLDLSRVRGFKLFAVDTATPAEMTIGNFRLESR